MRVFDAKFRVFLADILHHQARASDSILLKFQKCGLPHVHLALIMAPRDQVPDTATIAIVCAKLPDPSNELQLLALVQRATRPAMLFSHSAPDGTVTGQSQAAATTKLVDSGSPKSFETPRR